jgi:hypothetical protein
VVDPGKAGEHRKVVSAPGLIITKGLPSHIVEITAQDVISRNAAHVLAFRC